MFGLNAKCSDPDYTWYSVTPSACFIIHLKSKIFISSVPNNGPSLHCLQRCLVLMSSRKEKLQLLFFFLTKYTL